MNNLNHTQRTSVNVYDYKSNDLLGVAWFTPTKGWKFQPADWMKRRNNRFFKTFRQCLPTYADYNQTKSHYTMYNGNRVGPDFFADHPTV